VIPHLYDIKALMGEDKGERFDPVNVFGKGYRVILPKKR
jgi:hypothetical protein